MTKPTERHFNLFKRECEKWIERFKLDNWEVHYDWQSGDDNSRAGISANLSGYIVTIFLSREWDNVVTDKQVKECAKHEVIHLLLARLSANAQARYISPGDLQESEEEVIRKLEKLL